MEKSIENISKKYNLTFNQFKNDSKAFFDQLTKIVENKEENIDTRFSALSLISQYEKFYALFTNKSNYALAFNISEELWGEGIDSQLSMYLKNSNNVFLENDFAGVVADKISIGDFVSGFEKILFDILDEHNFNTVEDFIENYKKKYQDTSSYSRLNYDFYDYSKIELFWDVVFKDLYLKFEQEGFSYKEQVEYKNLSLKKQEAELIKMTSINENFNYEKALEKIKEEIHRLKEYLVENQFTSISFAYDSEGYEYSTSSLYC